MGTGFSWTDDRNGGGWHQDPVTVGLENWEVYMYDLSTSKYTYISSTESYSYKHDIYGDKIVSGI